MLRKTLFVIGATVLLAACSSKKDDANANAADSTTIVEEAVEVVNVENVDTTVNQTVAPAAAAADAATDAAKKDAAKAAGAAADTVAKAAATTASGGAN